MRLLQSWNALVRIVTNIKVSIPTSRKRKATKTVNQNQKLKQSEKDVNKLQNQYRNLLLPGVAKVVERTVFTRSSEKASR